MTTVSEKTPTRLAWDTATTPFATTTLLGQKEAGGMWEFIESVGLITRTTPSGYGDRGQDYVWLQDIAGLLYLKNYHWRWLDVERLMHPVEHLTMHPQNIAGILDALAMCAAWKAGADTSAWNDTGYTLKAWGAAKSQLHFENSMFVMFNELAQRFETNVAPHLPTTRHAYKLRLALVPFPEVAWEYVFTKHTVFKRKRT